MVFCLKEQFVQTDANISLFQNGTQLGLSAAAYSNISNNKRGGFPIFPTGHSRNQPHGKETNSPSAFKECEQTSWHDLFSMSQSLPSVQYPFLQ